ncbi:MAG: D-alanyl-D-alanine carboxypeptidase family protein [Gammaproteobacteria bacterium]
MTVFARVLLLCAVLSPPLVFAAPPPPNVASESYILMDADTGEVLGEKNADLRLPPASLTKIMSAHLVFNALRDGALRMEQEIVISRNAWAANVAGSKTFIEVGEHVSVRDLLYGVIVQSGNDAAIALAEALAGDEAAFAEWMNAEARKLSLDNTRFANSTGLPAKAHYTSARDIANIVRASVREHPKLYQIYAEREFTFNNITQQNRNGLLDSFDGADGVKTGYTKAAGYSLASSAKRNGRRIIAVVMKTKSPSARQQESAKLLNYGFAFFRNRRLFDENKVRDLPVFNGDKESVPARPVASGLMTVPRAEALRAVFHPQNPLLAPVKKGDEVGEIRVMSNDGEVLRVIKVAAEESIAEGGLWRGITDGIKLHLLGHGENKRLLAEW